jgi:CheY-like chemotaxis protein
LQEANAKLRTALEELALQEKKSSHQYVQQLMKAKEEAENANQAKDRFLAVLSHELRTPLTPVLALTSVLCNDPQLPPPVREDMQTIRRNIELEARIIDDLLDLTRISRGKIELHMEALDTHKAIHAALEMCRPEIESKGLEVSLALRARQRYVWADPARMQQIVANLLSNAVKFTREGGRIAVQTSNDDDGTLAIAIADTGIGIEPEMLPKIFKAFEQGEQAVTRKYGGLGLGLAICEALVRMHDGKLAAASEGKGRGATFTLRFDSLPTAADAPATAPLPDVKPHRKPLRILYVEDHEDTCKVMSRLLTGCGYVVTCADSVKSALAHLETEQFDVLVSDIGLPDGSGLDVMRTVRERQSLPGIALSGFGMEDDVRRSREAGFVQHLTKPVNVQKLEAAIAQIAQ